MKSLVSLWEQYSSLSTQSDIISFSLGIPNNHILNQSRKLVKTTLKKVTKSLQLDAQMLNYPQVQGLPSLIETLTSLSTYKSNQFLVTNGAQQALSLVFQTFIKPNDIILIDNHNYIGLQKPITNQQGKIKCFSKPLDTISISTLQSDIKQIKPKIIYLNPDFSNPTGYTLSLKKRKVIIKLAKKYSFTILEDQTYHSLVYQPKTQIPSFKQLYPPTISINTVSKTIAPGLRIGWINTPPKHLNLLISQKKDTDLFTSPITQLMLNYILKNQSVYQRHLKKIRRHYQAKMSILLNSLEKYFPDNYTWNSPKGGFFVWVTGPKSLNSKTLFNKAIKNGVSFMPSFIFSYGKSIQNNFRLSVSHVPKNQIKKGIKKLSQTLS